MGAKSEKVQEIFGFVHLYKEILKAITKPLKNLKKTVKDCRLNIVDSTSL